MNFKVFGGKKEAGKKPRFEQQGLRRPGFGRRKRQAVCIAAGLALGLVSQILAWNASVPRDGYVLARNPAGGGQQAYELEVRGLTDNPEPALVVLEERSYTEEEACGVYEEILTQLPELILGDNVSLDEVRTDLTLISSLEARGVSLKWQSDEPELLDSFGDVHSQGIPEAGKNVRLRVRLSDGQWPREFTLPVCLKPPLRTEHQQLMAEFEEEVRAQEELQRTGAEFKLPSDFKGHPLSYRIKGGSSFLTLTVLGILAAVLLELQEKSGLRQQEERRRQQLLLDYSEVLSRLIIFLGAGMSIRTAWDKIVEDYVRALKQGRCRERFVYQEMCVISGQLKSGISEHKAYAEFGRRCGLQQYIKLSGLLEQNRKNGSRNLRETLRLEMAEAFEQRKHQARRLGEEAGTKLLLPLFILLGIVMVIIAVPALIAFGN